MKKILFVIMTFVFANMAMAQNTSTTDEGVEINGVIWATRNVDVPGTFAENPEDAGMFYQWNRKIGWPATGEITGWNNSTPAGDTWETANNPCPTGWRVPTIEELTSLMDADSKWKDTPLEGRIFGSGDNTIFLPAAGYRDNSGGALYDRGYYGYYWSTSTGGDAARAYDAYFDNDSPDTNNSTRRNGFCVRCVKENIPAAVNNISSEKEKNILGYYSILGQKLLQEPQSGVYIIRYENGKTEKIVK